MTTRVRSSWLLGLALAGMVAGHWLGYALAAPDGGHRGRILSATGHERWELVVSLAVFGGATAVALLLWRAFRDGLRGAPATQVHTRDLMVRLAAFQTCLFVLTELLERALHGGVSAAMFTSAPFLIGIAVQGIIASLVAQLVHALTRVAGAIGRLLGDRRHYPPAAVPALIQVPARVPVRLLASAAGVRGPPSR